MTEQESHPAPATAPLNDHTSPACRGPETFFDEPESAPPAPFDEAAELRLFKDEFGRLPHVTKADGEWVGWLARARLAHGGS